GQPQKKKKVLRISSETTYPTHCTSMLTRNSTQPPSLSEPPFGLEQANHEKQRGKAPHHDRIEADLLGVPWPGEPLQKNHGFPALEPVRATPTDDPFPEQAVQAVQRNELSDLHGSPSAVKERQSMRSGLLQSLTAVSLQPASIAAWSGRRSASAQQATAPSAITVG